ncbi:MAPEG family protein [Marinicella sediminis]|uniref:MAPEG family protein n=1 Tax=Marinicella sediminis TaxID=1792834 RepID=A0ABV7J3S8_9GAMM|nr:MAPEG family protein [Marinicella sediminis]
MLYVAIVLSLVLLQYSYFSFVVGAARGKYSVSAPAVSGHRYFERAYRIQQNTLEQLIIVVPSMFLFASYVHPMTAAILGLVFFISRFIYFTAYMKDPKSRGMGFVLGFLASHVMLLGGLGGAVWRLF